MNALDRRRVAYFSTYFGYRITVLLIFTDLIAPCHYEATVLQTRYIEQRNTPTL